MLAILPTLIKSLCSTFNFSKAKSRTLTGLTWARISSKILTKWWCKWEVWWCHNLNTWCTLLNNSKCFITLTSNSIRTTTQVLISKQGTINRLITLSINLVGSKINIQKSNTMRSTTGWCSSSTISPSTTWSSRQ